MDADARARCGDEITPDSKWCGGYDCFGAYCKITVTPCATHYQCESIEFGDTCTGCDCVTSPDGECSEDKNGFATLRRTVDECLQCSADPFECD